MSEEKPKVQEVEFASKSRSYTIFVNKVPVNFMGNRLKTSDEAIIAACRKDPLIKEILRSPVIVSFSPKEAPPTGGVDVTFDGNNFTPGMQVFFGGVPSPSVTVENSKCLRAKVPAHSPGSAVPIVVKDGHGNTATASGFVYGAEETPKRGRPLSNQPSGG